MPRSNQQQNRRTATIPRFKPRTTEELKNEIDKYLEGESSYTDINAWDTSLITDMSYLFEDATEFNSPIDGWDTSNVTNMEGMFQLATKFNQPINSWVTDKVTNMANMFLGCKKFNQPINNWKTSKVTNMSGMFAEADEFNQPLDHHWDMSSVKNTSSMFHIATKFNQDLSSWDVSSIEDMNSMFHRATKFNQDLSSWDVSSVKDMRFMFELSGFNNNSLQNWNIDNVKYMDMMFGDPDNPDTKFKQYDSIAEWYPDIFHESQIEEVRGLRLPTTVAQGYTELFPENSNYARILRTGLENGTVRETGSTPTPTDTDTPISTQETLLEYAYNSTAETPTLPKSDIRIERNTTAFDYLSYSDINVLRSIATNKDILIVYYNNTYHITSRKTIKEILSNNVRSIVYECITVNDRNVPEMTIPYFYAKTIGLYGLIRLSDIKHILNHKNIRAIEMVSPPSRTIQTISSITVYGSLSDCQDTQPETLHDIKHIVDMAERITIKPLRWVAPSAKSRHKRTLKKRGNTTRKGDNHSQTQSRNKSSNGRSNKQNKTVKKRG